MNIVKRNSLSFTTLKYLVIFSITILFIMWVFQIAYLTFFYERYKINKINNIIEYIEKNPTTFVKNIEEKSYDYGICIEIINGNNSLVYNSMYKGCLLRTNNNENISSIKKQMYESKETLYKVKLIDPEYETKSILYGLRLNNGIYIYLNTTLENIESTSQILQSQMKYITLFVLVLSYIVAYYFSKRITRPIIKITNKARDLGNGNVSIKFDTSNIKELDELSSTLNIATAEFRKTDELRRDLMANVSHDLKTPLTMIKAYAEMVKDISYNNEEKRNEHLNIIITESERLNTLVNDILELSRIQSNNQELVITEFDVVEEIKNIINSYSIIKETLNYNFIINTPEKCFIKGDQKKINRVIYNLINNAINYTGADNKVYVTVTENKKKISISIKDTGKGINPEELNNIWNRYYKNDKNHRRNVIGTGLGLAIVKEVLEAHKYGYGVNTEKNLGTEFYFTINK